VNAGRAAQKFLGGNKYIPTIESTPRYGKKTSGALPVRPEDTPDYAVNKDPIRPLVQNDISSDDLRKIEPPNENLIACQHPWGHTARDNAYDRRSADPNFVRHRRRCRGRNEPRLVLYSIWRECGGGAH
jgi:hypothetical protein